MTETIGLYQDESPVAEARADGVETIRGRMVRWMKIAMLKQQSSFKVGDVVQLGDPLGPSYKVVEVETFRVGIVRMFGA